MTFLRATAHRAARTAAQVAVAAIGAATLISSVDWGYVASVTALAALLSVLTSISTDLPEVEG